ncbi:hypothetical protein HPP92_009715 [Vanilla planifolia]|uniref:Uncharacterized protein n=1 Tax=Vanilla planifolia TaxID=51239 RepID=A0A835V783_VANPL|nr:hypothetical protein HPP92_009715 [Vanilla planifolia]
MPEAVGTTAVAVAGVCTMAGDMGTLPGAEDDLRQPELLPSECSSSIRNKGFK